MRISIVCVYNNEKVLNKQLDLSLINNHVNCEKVFLNNSRNQYASAAQALNIGAMQATGDVLIFSHQDIYIKQPGEVERFADEIIKLPVGCILGAQGARETETENISNLTAGEKYNSQLGTMISSIEEVSCVDEGFFGMRRETYEMLKFNEELCDAWHLYSVELCLHARRKGYKVYVSPIQLHHFSWGKINRKYMKGLIILSKEYREHFNYIWTTCYKIRTCRVYVYGLYTMWCLNRKLRGRSLD